MTEDMFNYLVETSCPCDHGYEQCCEYSKTCKYAPMYCIDCWVETINKFGIFTDAIMKGRV